MRSKNYKSRAFIWDQPHLCSSFSSRVISWTRWVYCPIFYHDCLHNHLMIKKPSNSLITYQNRKKSISARIYKLRTFIWDESQPCSSICSPVISDTRLFHWPKNAKMGILSQYRHINQLFLNGIEKNTWPSVSKSSWLSFGTICSSIHSQVISWKRLFGYLNMALLLCKEAQN